VPSGTTAKRLLIGAGVGLLVLMVVGLVLGAVGTAVRDEDGEPYLKQPNIHLPPQPVFPASARAEFLGFEEEDASEGEAGPVEEEHELHPLGMGEFAVTSTLISAWFATIVIILFFVLAARKRSLVPGRFQGLVETLFEGILGFCGSVLGPEMARKAFPIIATIFFFVLFNAWLSLLPVYHFFGYKDEGGDIVVEFLRSAGTDLNMPLALALVSFVFVEYWGFRVHGFGYLKKFFALGNLFRGRLSGLTEAFVGFLEGVSELVRVVSFTFRLFGNMTAGEILLVMITFLVPFVATQFVFGLELLVGLIQAVIFASLTVVFLSVAVRREHH
jgi:F-type H+-transporting ATPase subunit a